MSSGLVGLLEMKQPHKVFDREALIYSHHCPGLRPRAKLFEMHDDTCSDLIGLAVSRLVFFIFIRIGGVQQVLRFLQTLL
jgi:hypothetical protein